MPAWLDKYAKALVGLAVAAFGLYQAAKGVDTPGGAGVTADEWVTIAVTSIFTGFGVWAVPNAQSNSLMPTTVVTDKVIQPVVTMSTSSGTVPATAMAMSTPKHAEPEDPLVVDGDKP